METVDGLLICPNIRFISMTEIPPTATSPIILISFMAIIEKDESCWFKASTMSISAEMIVLGLSGGGGSGSGREAVDSCPTRDSTSKSWRSLEEFGD